MKSSLTRSVILIIIVSISSLSYSSTSFDYVFSNHNWKAGLNINTSITRGNITGIPNLGNLKYKPYSLLSIGFHFSKRFSKLNFIETGLNYSMTGVKYSRESNPDFTIEFGANKEDVLERFEYLSIPIKSVFYFSDYRLRNYISIGACLNMVVAQKSYQTLHMPEGPKITNFDPDKKTHSFIAPSLRIGYGWEYDLEQDLSFNMEPFLGFLLFPGKSNASVLSFGLSMAVQMQGN